MIFQHSAITTVTSWQSEEQSATLPADVQPVYLGSGTVAFALDATGMQGLDARVIEQPEVVSLRHMTTHLSDDLLVCHAATLSKHYQLEHANYAADIKVHMGDSWALLPAGYFDYLLVIDGQRYAAEELRQAGTDWSRSFAPGTGTCITRFTVAGVQCVWHASIGAHSGLAVLPLELASVDGQDHQVELCVRIHLRTRREEELASGGLTFADVDQLACLQWDASSATSTAPLKEAYQLSYGIAMDRACTVQWHAPTLSATTRAPLPAGQQATVAIGLFFGCSQAGTGTLHDAQQVLARYRAEAQAALAQAQASWQQYFADAATFSAGDPQLEFVYHTNQYLMAAGADWAHGLPCNYLWNQNFMGSTFWDSYFMVEGMLRAGHVEQVRLFIRWLAETARQPERPYYWVHYYDGEPWADDVAYQVMAAHAGSAIRYYEYTRDREALERWVYPIVKSVAQYTRDHLIGVHRGLWRFNVIISGDVCGDDNPGTEETGILAWLVVAMAKTVEYGRLLGEDAGVLARLEEVVDSTRRNPYDWSKPVLWWAWLPYITGAEPFYDQRAWVEGIKAALMSGGVEHMRNNDIGQPWGAFSAAVSCLIGGLPDAGMRYIEEGMHQVYGHGAFCEFRYDQNENAGIAPLPTASGAYLSAIGALFAHGTVWNDDIQVLTGLPATWRSRRISFNRVRTPNGAVVSGLASPTEVSLTITTDRPRRVTLAVPVRLQGVPIALQVGTTSRTLIDPGDGTITFELTPGTHAVQVSEDLATPFSVMLYEPKYRARHFCDLLAAADLAPRAVRDPRRLAAYLSTAQVLLLPSSMIQLPAYLVRAVEAFVEQGGTLIGLHHAGCSEVNPRLAELFGVRAFTEDRFKSTFTARSFLRVTEHALAAGVPAAFPVATADRLSTARIAADVMVIFEDGETHDALVTLREVGDCGGQAIWLAPGQETGDPQPLPYSQYDALDYLGQRRDTLYRYPYLDSPHFRRLLVNAVKLGLMRTVTGGTR